MAGAPLWKEITFHVTPNNLQGCINPHERSHLVLYLCNEMYNRHFQVFKVLECAKFHSWSHVHNSYVPLSLGELPRHAGIPQGSMASPFIKIELLKESSGNFNYTKIEDTPGRVWETNLVNSRMVRYKQEWKENIQPLKKKSCFWQGR